MDKIGLPSVGCIPWARHGGCGARGVFFSMFLRLATRAGLAALAALAIGASAPASAQIGSDRYSAIVLDHRTGNALVQASPDETRHPASLTKMMTLYMVFEALREGRLSLDSRVPMSEEAASRPPSKLGIPAGHSITVEQAILALVTRSANDVAAAVGERIGGSEARFAQMMTLRARAIGMTRTTFRNASGLPDPDQVTTARDMANLGRRLLSDFPDRYHYFGVTHARFGGLSIRNHNRMLDSYEGVDGIKTGYIRDSGFNIVTSAMRGGQRVVGAVFGGSSWVERDAHMAVLLDEGFGRLGVAVARAERSSPILIREAEAAPLPRGGRALAASAPAVQRGRVVAQGSQREAAGARRPARATATARTAARSRTAQPATVRPVASRQAASRPVAAGPAAAREAKASTRRPAAAPVRPNPPSLLAPPAGRIRTAELR
jgi:D-alanyl-D-alanine carboxypeptidase